jgi:hypothetical protein
MEADRVTICEVLEAMHPQTLRGLFYQLVSHHGMAKTDDAYDRLGKMLLKLRKDGRVPWEHIIDNTRDLHELETFSTVSEGLNALYGWYRRDPGKISHASAT